MKKILHANKGSDILLTMKVIKTNNQFIRAADVKIPEIYNRRFKTGEEDLDALFGGDSGAEAGDSNGAAAPEDGATEDATDESGAVAPTPAPEDGDADTGVVISTELQLALADARAALLEREAAYRANDLVAAAEADRRLTDALNRALVLSNQ